MKHVHISGILRKTGAFLAFICCCTPVFAASDRNFLSGGKNSESVLPQLLLHQKWVKYPSYADRTGWDVLLGENKSMLITRGEKQLNYSWKVIKASDYLEYELSGNRNIMQNPNSDNNNALADLVLAELAEGKGRFMSQIINGVFYQTERTSWALSAHLPVQKSKRSLPDYTEQIVDLGSAELGAFLAWTYYFLHEEMDKTAPVIAQRLREDIYHKVILPYRDNDYFWWQGFHPREDGVINNWNPWCNANVLQCVLLLEDDPVQLSKDVFRTMSSVDKFINYIHADGACEEGPSYWEHAAGKLYDYLQLLCTATNGGINLFDNKMIKDMGEYISRSYVGNNWVVNFADASARFSAKGSLIYRYGKAVNSSEMMRFAALLTASSKHTLTLGLDFFRTLESIYYDAELKQTEAGHSMPGATVYPETQFYYFRNKQGFFLAAKGGHNDESHNHNDIGTCSLWFEETPILIDAGVGTYTRQTFGPERYTIWTMRSAYHNLPLINGIEQQHGRTYAAKQVKCDEKNKTLAIDIANAYPSEAQVASWIRSYRLEENRLVINDNFILKKALKPTETNFMLWGKIDVSEKGKVRINVLDKNMELLYDAKQFDASIETIALPDSRLSNVWGNEIYRLTLKAKKTIAKGTHEFIIRKA
ncbi:MAG: heparinase II/III-family protein [Prevotella sp.]|jgi:hypothetical protein|nr:heparinase II/III-family protein [Prevotella sp.]